MKVEGSGLKIVDSLWLMLMIECGSPLFVARSSLLLNQNVIKVPYRYAVQVSDTTMMTIAASLFGQYY